MAPGSPGPLHVEEESIYNLIPRAQVVPPRPSQHRSTHSGKTHPGDFVFGQNKLKGHASFGLPNGMNAVPPTKFTRKHEKEPILPEPQAPTNPKPKLRAPVPTREEKPVMGLSSNKNFITHNAVTAILSKPGRVPQDEFVWTTRPGYGKVPMYLRRVKGTIHQEREQFEEFVRLRTQPDEHQHVTQLTEEERQSLIRHLKLKWASVNDAYQKGALCVDTEQKKHKKEELERKLAEIERDIKMLERGEMVLVVDD